MTPRDFCNWFEGVLDMATNEKGGAHFNEAQVKKLRVKLQNAMAEPPPKPSGPRPPRPGRPPGDIMVRC